ncbi:TonB-dependent receptor [Saccharicrinis fermentans]|uniref:TonB-dependent receptor n=1 Tax=Saccharicrinis fermentans TaxID=982 RepID=UPI0005C63CBB|nr:TonB-dependent receptor plug domain-containing protein [Saccharicrinis fermentans]
MTESVMQIGEVQVAAKGKISQTREQPFQVSVLDAKPLQVQSQPVTGLVNQISGVRVREDGGLGSNVNIMLNGISGKGIRIFVDDIPADLLGNGVAINNLPVNMIDHIEVYKGVIPTKFGSDALGGILNLVTRNVKKDYLDISAGMGSFGTYQASLNSRKYFGDKNNAFVGISGFYNHSDNDYRMDDVTIRVDELNNTTTGSVRRFNDAYIAYSGKVSLGLRYANWADLLRLDLTASQINKEWQHGMTTERPWGEAFSEESNLNVELKWKKSQMLNKKLNAIFNAGYSYINTCFIDTTAKTYYWGAVDGLEKYVSSSPGESGYYVDGRNPVQYISNSFIRFNLSYLLDKTHKLSLTSLYTRSDINGHDERGIASFGADILSNPQSLNKFYNGIALESKFWGDKITNILSGKFFAGNAEVVALDETINITGYNNNSYQRWGYGDAIKILLFPFLNSTLSFEHTYRMPDKDELFGDFISVFPNAELEPEESQNLDLGLRFKCLKSKLTFNINSFFRNTSNLIFLNSLNAWKSTYMNLLETQTIGFEGELKVSPLQNMNLYANLTWQDIILKDVDDNGDIEERYIGANVPNIPWLFGNAGFSYMLPWHITKSDKINIFYTCNYVHDFFLSWEIDGITSTKATIPQQVVHNAGISYTTLNNRLSFSLETKNITDEKVYDNYMVQKPGRSYATKIRFFISK